MIKQVKKEICSEKSARLGTYVGRFTTIAHQRGASPEDVHRELLEFWNSEQGRQEVAKLIDGAWRFAEAKKEVANG